MASMAFRIFEKQKHYKSEYSMLEDKCKRLKTEKTKLEEDLNATRRKMRICTEQCRVQDLK
eukprot:4539565-Amphidinium_carterae.1